MATGKTPNRTIKARALIAHGGKILMLERLNGQGGHAYYQLPGGGMQKNENPEDAVRREILEETGYSIIGTPRLVWVRQNPEKLEFIFVAHISRKNTSPAQRTKREQKTLGVAVWLNPEEYRADEVRPRSLTERGFTEKLLRRHGAHLSWENF